MNDGEFQCICCRINSLFPRVPAILRFPDDDGNPFSDELTVKTPQYEGTIDALTVQVNQLKVTCTEKTKELADANSRVWELQMEVSTLTAQFTELQVRYETQSKELISVSKQLQTMTMSCQDKDHELSSLSIEPREYGVQSHVQYGVICALPVDATDEDHNRRKHLWERDPTGDCYVPGYFESKLRMASLLSQLSCEMLTI